VSPRAGLDVVAKREILPCRESNHNRPACRTIIPNLIEIRSLVLGMEQAGGVHLMHFVANRKRTVDMKTVCVKN
jgi:hypothetical protein